MCEAGWRNANLAPAMNSGDGSLDQPRNRAGAAKAIDDRFAFGFHAPQYAIIGSSSQLKSSDIRDCDCRRHVCNRHMVEIRATQPEAIEIFEALDRLGLKQRDLARALGLEENKISKARSGERQFKVGEVARAKKWLESRPQVSESAPTIPSGSGEIVEITQIDLSLAMGNGTLIDGYIEEVPVQFDLGYIRSFTKAQPSALRIAHGVGESMQPTLLSNDMVWIDTSQRTLTLNDRIWAVSIYGAAAIKRLRRVGDRQILVMSDNPLVPDQEVDAEHITIAGRVIRFARDL